MSTCCVPGFILGINSLVLGKTYQEVGAVAAIISETRKQGANHLCKDTQLVGGRARLEPRQTQWIPSAVLWRGLGYTPTLGGLR